AVGVGVGVGLAVAAAIAVERLTAARHRRSARNFLISRRILTHPSKWAFPRCPRRYRSRVSPPWRPHLLWPTFSRAARCRRRPSSSRDCRTGGCAASPADTHVPVPRGGGAAVS